MCSTRLSVLLEEAATILRRVGANTPRLDARLIAGHVFSLSNIEVLTNPDLMVGKEKAKEFFEVIARRISGIPVSHILRKREFWSMDFEVCSDVLDPRQDTETIISSVIDLYTNPNCRITIADLGTGSGCIIVALLSHYKNAVGVAYEKSVKAYRIASQNLKKYDMARRVRIYRASWEQCKGKFDLIVSNPPYIKRSKLVGLQPEVRCHEPIQALDGGIRGMEKYIQIFQVIKRCLKPDGRAILEIGEDQQTIRTEALQHCISVCGYVRDLAGRQRCVILKKQR